MEKTREKAGALQVGGAPDDWGMTETGRGLNPDAKQCIAKPEPMTNQASQKSMGHLLIADDEQPIRQLMMDRIPIDLDCRISTAEDGKKAFEQFKSDPADVILTDIRMPEMSGLELVCKVKRLDPTVQFILMSGHGDNEDIVRALRLGTSDFFTKPFDMIALIDSIERAFKRIRDRSRRGIVRSHLVREQLHFELPNDVEIVPQIISELTSMLDNDPGIPRMEIDDIRASLHEIILNAIEHGNLEISYGEKSKLMESPENWQHEVRRRAADTAYRNRSVTIHCYNTADKIEFTISDCGQGFDYSRIPKPAEMLHSLHGRGIMIARVHMDEVNYNDKGNQVTLVKYKKNSRASAA